MYFTATGNDTITAAKNENTKNHNENKIYLIPVNAV